MEGKRERVSDGNEEWEQGGEGGCGMGEAEVRKGGMEGSVESLPSCVSDGKRVTWVWWRGLPWVAARPRVLQRVRHARAGTSSTVRSRLTRSDPPPQQDRGGDADAGLARAARRGVWAWRRSTPQPTPRTTQDEGCFVRLPRTKRARSASSVRSRAPRAFHAAPGRAFAAARRVGRAF